jgi:hypothetical protein
LENQPAVASRLERALFVQGFEVLHLENDEAYQDALLETIRVTEKIGAVVIYSGEPIDAATKKRLASELKHQLFDLSGKNENTNDEEVFRRGLELADSLRFAKPQHNQEEVD